MKLSRHGCRWPWLALAAALGTYSAAAQNRRLIVEEPQPFKLRLTEVDAGVYGEGIFEETTFQNSGTSVSHSRYFIGPSAGFIADGSIYHPNLLRYQVNSEGAFGWAEDVIKTPTHTQSRSELEYLGRFQATADLLSYKPYRASFFGGYDHSYRDYDFFNRVTVDSWRYGGRATYNDGPFYLGATYHHRDEEVTGFDRPSVSKDDVVSLDGRYDRERGGTTVGYTFSQYDRLDYGTAGTGVDHTFSVADNQRFGDHDQYRLNTSASYNHREATFDSIDQLTSQANFEAQHKENLSSFYDVNYDRYQSGDFSSDTIMGRTELRHQLYSSLSSRLIGQASSSEGSDQRLSGYTRRFGGGLAESYTKHLSENHQLRVDHSVMVEHVEQRSMGVVENERHSFSGEVGSTGDSFYLNLPNVFETSIVLKDRTGIQSYVRGLDYDVISGSRTLITLRPGTRIGAGDSVLVDYRAEPSPPGDYENLTDFFQVRFDLYKHLWGIYGRVNLSLNNAPAELRVQDIRAYTFGTDVNWRWLRAGAEYVIYDSDQSQYQAARLFQGFTFRPDEASSLSLNFTESWTDYVDAHRQEQDFRFITRYRRVLTSNLGMELEGGIDIRRGQGVDQTLATVRPSIQYSIGKLSLSAGYDYEYNLFLNNEERQKHMFFLRGKRVF